MATFRPDLRGYREFHRTASGMHAGLEPIAQRIAERAKGAAPVESAESAERHDRAPGRFRDSIHTERHRGPTYQTVRVVADSPAAAVVEARSGALRGAAG